MSDETITTSKSSLHKRALQAGLDLLDQQQSRPPRLVDVAVALDVPRCHLEELFPSDMALLHAAGENALLFLIDSATKAVVQADPKDAVAQFQALGHAYLKWAVRFPRQYRLLTEDRVIDILEIPQLRRYSDSVHSVMVQMLRRAHDAGQLHEREDVVLLAVTSRTFAHGMARMIIDGRMREFFPNEDPLEAGLRALDDFIRKMARAALPAE